MNPQDQNLIMPSKKVFKYLIAVVIAAVIILVAMLFWNNYNSQATVTILPTESTTITIGTTTGEKMTIDNVVIKTDTNLTKKIKKGSYQIEYSRQGYEDKFDSITIDKNTTINTPGLNYSQDHLNQLLNNDRSVINGVVLSGVPSGYTITKESIYRQGDWYSAVLMPQNWYRKDLPANYVPKQTDPNNTQDVLRVILKKDGNDWKIVAGPSVIFYIGDFPNIPQEIIRDVNNKPLT